MKKISILGSTGSIGVNTLDVVQRYPEKFEIVGLAAGSNVDLLVQQIKIFKPKIASIFDTDKLEYLKKNLNGYSLELTNGEEGSVKVATLEEVNTVVSGIVGGAGLVPTFAALKAGKNVALANKETLVIAGELVLKAARNGAGIIPIDSEHSAIFQALNGEKKEHIKRIILTASGGPFRTYSREKMENVTVEEALNHPNWKMGNKITIDSATLMNKGLEYIEAKWLFGLDVQVDVIVHPQSIVHSMVEFVDTSIIAQLGIPDMRIPIAYALTYPDRFEMELPSLDLTKCSQLNFEEPDFDKFPCLKLAFEAQETGQTMPAVLNAANEVVVEAFLEEQVLFKDIPEIIRATMRNHEVTPVQQLKDILTADCWAREEARKQITVAC